MSFKEDNELLRTFDLYDFDDLDELESCDLDEIFSTSNFDRRLNEELELAGFDQDW